MHARRGRSLSSALVAAVLLVAVAPAGAAAAAPSWGEGVAVGKISGPGDPGVTRVECATAGNCVTFFRFVTARDMWDGVVTQTDGAWGEPILLQPPADAKGKTVTVNGASCPAAGRCVAVGTYYDTAGAPSPVIWTQSDGTWSRGVRAPQRPGLLAKLADVDCPTVGGCTAVGSTGSSSEPGALWLLSERADGWVENAAALPADTYPGSMPELSALDCASQGNCTAVGYYLDTAAHRQGLVVTQSGGAWGPAVRSALPPDAAPAPAPVATMTDLFEVTMRDLSCGAPASCVAIGGYTAGSPVPAQMIVTQAGSQLGAEAGPASPEPTGERPVITSLSCPASNACAAVGVVSAPTGMRSWLYENAGGAWRSAQIAPPGDASATPPALATVSCARAGECAVTGSYVDKAGHRQAMFATQAGGVWERAVKATLPPNAASDPQAEATAVACSAPGRCTAAGTYRPGELVMFTQPAVTPAALRSDLRAALAVTGADAKIARILAKRGYVAAVTVPTAGTQEILWQYRTRGTGGAARAAASRTVIVAKGRRTFKAAGTADVRVRLTARGRAVLRKAKRVKLTAQATFAPKKGAKVRTQRSVTLRR